MLAKLKEETRLKEEAEMAKANLMTELTNLREKTDKAKAVTMAEFHVSQPLFDPCDTYYGDEFDECLKQVEAAYPDLDLSQIMMDNIIPLMLREEDTISEETVDSVHTIEQEAKNTNAKVFDQPISEGPDDLVALSIMEPTTTDGPTVVDPNTSSVPLA